jgi:hypothetical protein
MRVAFTIVLNGLHHLQHNRFALEMVHMFDYWVIVEGVAKNTGSTSWCAELQKTDFPNGLSTDGTTQFLTNLEDGFFKKVKVIRCGPEGWANKDEQVNAAIRAIKEKTNEAFLWQVDVDEQWGRHQYPEAENLLRMHNAKTGCFLCNCYVGPNQQARGDWGEGRKVPYRRLWDWKGEYFKTHEPPVLEGKNGPGVLLPTRFNHYSYFFEQDVLFKEKYYNYEGLHQRWLEVQKNNAIIPIKNLLGEKVWWGLSNTVIEKVDHVS